MNNDEYYSFRPFSKENKIIAKAVGKEYSGSTLIYLVFYINGVTHKIWPSRAELIDLDTWPEIKI